MYMIHLTGRRAEFVYNAARLAALAANAPIVPDVWDQRELAFQLQFFEVIDRQCGPERKSSAKVLHEDWVEAYRKMGWVYGKEYSREYKTHPDMVPYEELGQLEKDKDDVFIALCEVARLYIHE